MSADPHQRRKKSAYPTTSAQCQKRDTYAQGAHRSRKGSATIRAYGTGLASRPSDRARRFTPATAASEILGWQNGASRSTRRAIRSAAVGGKLSLSTSAEHLGSVRRAFWAFTMARTTDASRSPLRAMSSSVVIRAAKVNWRTASNWSPSRRMSMNVFPTPLEIANSAPMAFAKKPSTMPSLSAPSRQQSKTHVCCLSIW